MIVEGLHSLHFNFNHISVSFLVHILALGLRSVDQLTELRPTHSTMQLTIAIAALGGLESKKERTRSVCSARGITPAENKSQIFNRLKIKFHGGFDDKIPSRILKELQSSQVVHNLSNTCTSRFVPTAQSHKHFMRIEF